jgi:protein-arginine kinase activator protein McsA
MAQATIDNKIIHDFAKGLTRHWLTPPDVYKKLDDEFHFTFDPCPCPKPRGYNSLEIEWGEVNYVNPPFITTNGIGPTAFAKRAIEESRKLKCPACGHEYQSRAEKKARCVECSHEFYPAMNRVVG